MYDKNQNNNELRGEALLRNPLYNKGTAFSERERDDLGLRGLLPPHIHTQEEQMNRFLTYLRTLPEPIQRYVALTSLHDRNEALFFRLVCDHIEEIMPIIYTPTVGVACQRFGEIFHRPRGMFLSINDRGHLAKILRNWPRQAGIIVVTDGERILGLGDQGANGMGIPIGKLALYTAIAGIDPGLCLPITLDVGTNNEELRSAPYYVGLRQERVRGAAYDEFIEEFVTAACEVFPNVIIQFEDFANRNAFSLLEKYRDRICTFNDDIQGTASVALAGLFSALRIKNSKLTDEKFLFLGAGEAATGIANLIVASLIAEGCDPVEARRHCWFVDSQGLVVASRSGLSSHKQTYAHDHPGADSFLSALREIKPTAIIGVAAAGGAFTAEVLQEMAVLNDRPIVFALSNPTSKAECTAEQAYRETNGRALFASGSPFEPVLLGNRNFEPRQGNNAYIFPGIGLGAIASGASRITDDMFLAAAKCLAAQVTKEDLDRGSLFPPLSKTREVSAHIAAATASVAYRQGLAQLPHPEDILSMVRTHMYDPRY